jgi:hypothetical protein
LVVVKFQQGLSLEVFLLAFLILVEWYPGQEEELLQEEVTELVVAMSGNASNSQRNAKRDINVPQGGREALQGMRIIVGFIR